MALTDAEVQKIQIKVKDNVDKQEGDIINIGTKSNPEYYQVVNGVDETTQALAVVPVDNIKGDNPDYSQTAIVVAGT
ncbi:hypothetical protein DDV21_002445 [Streptococcus chenjunshii]|uniref:Uncharacterized protein n=1 Tax=Streptococcus chenjunshii TaxID=2173853 RepID=A0A372KIX4_9STRE|nr:hypothetical protein [Streptococcus chenjunshii]AXQ78011.1 hypothetical protein DDV21_002445 [Streptococcus chenjunshii]RFU51744.1 hypothetical protein DDV22_01320 [Streptococcus chenjunshii]RFU52217.1 hypothetical protein DDV23_10855 [Streptococcus chenjunshii]